jgi:hypothetical protein
VNEPLGQAPALLLMQEGAAMFSVDLTARDSGLAVLARRPRQSRGGQSRRQPEVLSFSP